jgi:hypothetical protein
MNFFDKDFVKAMVTKSFPNVSLQSVDAFTLVASAVLLNPAILYVGFVLDAVAKNFTLGSKTYKIDAASDSGKGWLVFDSFSDAGAGDAVLFTGFKVTVRVPIGGGIDYVPPTTNYGVWVLSSYYFPTSQQFLCGLKTPCDQIRITDGINTPYLVPVVDGFVKDMQLNQEGGQITIEFLLGGVSSGSSLLTVANSRHFTYASNATSLSFKDLHTAPGFYNSADITIAGKVYKYPKLEVGRLYTLYLTGFTAATMDIKSYDIATNIRFNQFMISVAVGIDALDVDGEELPFIEVE